MLDCGRHETWRRYLGYGGGRKIGDLIMSRQKPLRLPRRLEPLHDPLSSSGRLVGILRPVVEAFVLPMLDAGHDLTLGRSVAAKLVGDQHARRLPLLLQELAEQAFCGLLISPALDEAIENQALLVDRAPEPVLLARDAEEDLVKVPFVAAAGGSPTKAVGELLAEFQAPLPDRLVGDQDAAGRQHLFDHAQAQREPEIQPDRIADELGGVAIASVKRVSGRRHSGQISDHPNSAKPEAAQLDGADSTAVLVANKPSDIRNL